MATCRVGHYTVVSSVSVYPEFPLTGLDETAPVARITPEQLQEAETIATGARATARTYGQMYGALKALCEQAAEDAMPDNGIFEARNDRTIAAGLARDRERQVLTHATHSPH